MVRTRIALPFIGRFRTGLDRFFGSDSTFRHATQFSRSSLGGATIFAKLRSKIAKSGKIGGKVCAHLIVQIAEGFEKNLQQQFRVETVDVHLYKFVSARRYIALIASVKFRIGGPKTDGYRMDCSCAPMFRFFSVASDGATTERQIQNRVFRSISYQFEEAQRRQLCIDLDPVFAVCQRTRCAL